MLLKTLFPFLGWFKNYRSSDLRADALSGLTVALVLIPQSMAYAQLAGLPPFYGLYASFLPPMVAALFGSSRQLATGPVAVVSLMTAASLEPLATAGSDGYIAYAVLLALMVGVFQFSLGVLRLGVVVNFLSHPVVNGFTNAAAIIIATSQLSKLFGVSVDSTAHHYETVYRVLKEALHYTHWPTFGLGALAFAVMFWFKRVAPRVPNVLIAVALTTGIAWATGYQHNARVPLEDIQSQEIMDMVRAFNRAVEAVPPLAEALTGAYARLDDAETAHDTLGVIDARHDAEVVRVKMDAAKREAASFRGKLRRVLLSGVPRPEGGLWLFPRSEVPPSAQTDGRTWRIRVGNRPLAEEALPLKGGGDVVGEIPRGLPPLSPPQVDIKVMARMLPYAAIISLLGFMEAISIAKAMAGKTGQRLDPNQELIGQGLANILGAMGKSFPVSGSFSRSAVNLQSGARTGMSSVFTSLAVLVVLFLFTPLLYYLPQPVLAAIIMMAVVGLLNVSGFVHAWRAKWYDGAISVVTFAATLAFAPHLDKGIMIGVVLSLSVFIYKSMRPTVASLSRVPDQSFRDAVAHGVKQCQYVAMVRFDGPLFFANASYLEDRIMERMRSMPHLRHILIVCNGINDIDASGEETLSLLVDRVRSAGVEISLSGVNETVMEVMRRTFLLEKIGAENVYPLMERAICAIHDRAHVGNAEESCPLTTVCHIA